MSTNAIKIVTADDQEFNIGLGVGVRRVGLVVVRLGKTPADLRANLLASLRRLVAAFPATGGRA